MFGFSIPELLVIVTVGLVVLGPKQSLELSLNIAKAFNKIKTLLWQFAKTSQS